MIGLKDGGGRDQARSSSKEGGLRSHRLGDSRDFAAISGVLLMIVDLVDGFDGMPVFRCALPTQPLPSCC